MADNATIRLNKVLRELNISLDRAVDYLASKGFQVEARPTTKISDEVYEVLLAESRTDKSRKVASKEIGEEKRKEKEAIRIQLEQEQEERRVAREKRQAQTEVVKARVELAGPKTVGKIDLDAPAKKKEEEPKPEVVKPEAVKPEVVKPEVVKPEPEAKAEALKPQPAEPQILETEYQKLSGPKIKDKIDLSQFEKPKKKKEEGKDDSDRKRRRRRITTKAEPGARGKTAGKKQRFAAPKVEPTEEEVQKQVRETLEKLQGKTKKGKGAKYRRDKRDLHRQQTERDLEQQELESKILKVTEFVTVGEVATMMGVPTTDIISACMSLGIMVTMNQRLDAETLSIVAEEFGFEVEFVTADIEQAIEEEPDAPEDLKSRAPIVTVMGHVDHGKTSLLDYIRKENVIAGESGGITQHIGAYSVSLENGQKITFLDTPGHEAFTAMRARGAQVTDIAIIVIAADDDIMPQTREAISHAQAAGVPIVFAINKVDKPTANPEKIKEGLANMNLLVEDWGGKIQSQDISAKTGKGVAELLEKVLLEAELLELQANPDRNASGTVVEAFLDKGRGYVSTVLVENGTLHVGDYLLAGTCSGKVRAMHDERGKVVKTAGPSTPISVLGLDGAPQAVTSSTFWKTSARPSRSPPRGPSCCASNRCAPSGISPSTRSAGALPWANSRNSISSSRETWTALWRRFPIPSRNYPPMKSR